MRLFKFGGPVQLDNSHNPKIAPNLNIKLCHNFVKYIKLLNLFSNFTRKRQISYRFQSHSQNQMAGFDFDHMMIF